MEIPVEKVKVRDLFLILSIILFTVAVGGGLLVETGHSDVIKGMTCEEIGVAAAASALFGVAFLFISLVVLREPKPPAPHRHKPFVPPGADA